MNKLKIPKNHSGISKTLRLPENIVDDIQLLADIKNLSFNKVVISLLGFSLQNLDENDKKELESIIVNRSRFNKYLKEFIIKLLSKHPDKLKFTFLCNKLLKRFSIFKN